MLEDAERSGFEQIVAWHLGGRAFKVVEKDAFVHQILPKYFSQTSYKSFLRQVNLYGFSRISKGEAKGGHAGGCYHHKALIRGQKDLCLKMSRQFAKQSSSINLGAMPSSNTSLSYSFSTSLKHLSPTSNLETAIKFNESTDKKLPSPVYGHITDITAMYHSDGDNTMDDESDDVSDHMVDFHSWDGRGAAGISHSLKSINGRGHDAGGTSAAVSAGYYYGITNTTVAKAPLCCDHRPMTTKEAIPGYSGMFDVAPHDLDSAKNLLESVDLFKHEYESSGSITAPLPARRRL
jgi:hypothetical protein